MFNLEAKFRLPDHAAAQAAAIAIGYRPEAVLNQRDTFFVVATGKLKLREEDQRSYLIGYGRVERDGLQLSDYQLVPVPDPAAMRALLAGTLGVLAEVRKRRTLLLCRNVRLHLDEVDGLGLLGEIEAVVPDGGDPEAERAFVDTTLAALGVGREQLIEGSYFEMARTA
ncbi:MAG: class IV adenylate cyclase [Gammaproteobacteria bacterium]|uniref:class IV adenylate cyclase n=1 Tax=Nevskia sp. TaxID=1929292 RepID=UPI004035E25A|nr:class IV adenylate cyclase [Gammaproteobacteria bacterium]